jgi:hypothetical protein
VVKEKDEIRTKCIRVRRKKSIINMLQLETKKNE